MPGWRRAAEHRLDIATLRIVPLIQELRPGRRTADARAIVAMSLLSEADRFLIN